jgi:uncharacterized GH25 family protein
MPVTVGAHEYWIEPAEFRVDAGGDIRADLKVGEDFKGNVNPYIPSFSLGAWVVDSDGLRDASSSMGDIPAFTEAVRAPGLQVLAYYSKPARLTYTEPGKFARFLAGKGLDWALDEHRARGLPETGFVEAFSRCAKAFVQSGASGGEDVFIGLPLELVAGANPYTLPAAASAFPVTLLWQGEPLADAQIAVFRENDGLEVTKVRTDTDGKASIPLGAGGKFLLNAVHIIPWDKKPDDAWHSYWASLTFEIADE